MVENLWSSLSGQELSLAEVHNRLCHNRCSANGSTRECTTDIGCSDHILAWVELGRAAKNSKKGKRVIRRWRLDRFGDDEVKLRYQNGLRAGSARILREH